MILLIMPYRGVKNIIQLFGVELKKYFDSKKDAFYELMRNDSIDWWNVIKSFTVQFLKAIELNSAGTQNDGKPACLVVDDTVLEKTGKRMEFIGKVFDHTAHVYNLGFKLLTLCFWDGKSTLPIDFSLHIEPGKNNMRGMSAKELRKQYSKQRDIIKRVRELSENKIEVAIGMIKRALKLPINPRYILADSWFMCSVFITGIKQLSGRKHTLDVIGMMKTTRKVSSQGKHLIISKLPDIYQSQIRYYKALKRHYVRKRVNYKSIELLAYMVRPKGQGEWKLLVSTDRSLSFVKVMEIYAIRWSIEVFFKDCKQNLDLGKCQSVDFNAQLASITISFYGLLAVKKRVNEYETIGGVFRYLQNQVFETNLVDRIWWTFSRILNSLFIEIMGDWDVFMENVSLIIQK